MTRLVTTLGEAKRLPRDFIGFLCVVAALASPLCAHAGPPVINSESTNLSGDSELMISYRHQERMWQTADGGLHLVVNRGTSPGNPALVLNSSFDGGVTWINGRGKLSYLQIECADDSLDMGERWIYLGAAAAAACRGRNGTPSALQVRIVGGKLP